MRFLLHRAMLKKISFALILGVLSTIFFAQYDYWTHKKIVLLFQKVAQESLGAQLSCSVGSVGFFSPSLVLHDVEMKAIDSDSWSWRCKKCEVNCSWIQLVLKGFMEQHVIIDDFECKTSIEQSRFAIEPHILAMMQESLLPFAIELKSILFRNAHFYACDEQHKGKLSLLFNSSSLRMGHQMKTTMSISDGNLAYCDNNYIENFVADFFATTLSSDDAYDVGVQVAGTFTLPHMADQGGCYVTGSWKGDRGRFSVRNAYNTFMIDPIVVTEHELRINSRFPLSYVAQCIAGFDVNHMAKGTAHCAIKMSRDDNQFIDGQLIVEDVVTNKHHICDAGKIVFTRHDDDWKVRLAISRYNQECKGVGYWHQSSKKGELVMRNVTELSAKALSYWRIKPNNFFLQVITDQDRVVGNYETVVINVLNDVIHKGSGTFSWREGLLGAQGFIDENQFSIGATVSSCTVLHHFLYKDKDDKQLISLQTTADDAKHIAGSISFPFIRSLINNVLKYDVQGEGSLDVAAVISPTEIMADVALNEATIRLPQTYNFIDGFNAHCVYSIAHRSLILEDINLSLHTGKMNSLRATARFDQNGSLVFMHAPLIIDGCLLNIKKDLFAIVSGNLLLSKPLGLDPHVDGHIIIDKAQLKENLFSRVIQKQLFSYTHSAFSLPEVALGCDLIIETKSPIVVDTGFLQTDAHVNVRVKKDRHEPSVAGSIVLNSGTLNFPYKPLYISKGVITFPPEQLFDPAIELVARNKIKKYEVSLQVEGSLSTHHIALDSTPPLSEEQIVGLLLVGAEEHSLNSMMPALIVQNLKNLIFSNNQSSFFDKYFKPLLGSFNINLVPSFTDQTGRGGLRGALEITIDDRWRAVIQKNFSLTEDTKFELEFLLSDDITLRAIRDERRDLGGEVEMRWKF